MSITEIFSLADETLLQREAKRIPLGRLLLHRGELAKKEEIVRLIVAYHGNELFYKEGIRHCFFSAFPLEVLAEECKKLGLAPASTTYDTAIRLASIPWNVRSGIVSVVQILAERFFGSTVQVGYLPSISNQRDLSIEAFYSESVPPLFDYQAHVSGELLKYFSTRGARVMLQMPTGSGKTRTTTHALAKYLSINQCAKSGIVLWLAHARELCDQAVESLRKSWSAVGSGELRLYKLWGDHAFRVDALETGVVVSSLQKMVSLKSTGAHIYHSIASMCKAIVFDEAHKALAPTYKDLLSGIAEESSECVIVGLSATPGRKTGYDKENERLAEFFHGNILRPMFPEEKSPLIALRQRGILAELRRIVVRGSKALLSRKEKEYLAEYLDFSNAFLETMAHDENRNSTIVDSTVKCLSSGMQCLLFACSVEHARDLSCILSLKGYASVAVTSHTPRHVRDEIVAMFKQGTIRLIANYDVFSTGFDAPNIDVVIVTRPTTSVVLYNQMIGRGLRGPAIGGRPYCTLIDVVDNFVGFGEEDRIYNHFAMYWE